MTPKFFGHMAFLWCGDAVLRRPKFAFVFFFAMTSIVSSAALPPKYLEVSGFQKCLEVKQVGRYKEWRMPKKKPVKCKKKSWDQLLNQEISRKNSI